MPQTQERYQLELKHCYIQKFYTEDVTQIRYLIRKNVSD